MTQMLPVSHVVFIHRGTPAEHIVTDKKVVQYTDNHRNHTDPQKYARLCVKLPHGHFMR
ncbi:hypothetical protein SDC9_167335 [bioreactor metagenome]|uniref:Uncharacterized protein n=1 Tax=bioreactor metagenome TaxID=1076179 RepID=A0A645G234_9ZZZZ